MCVCAQSLRHVGLFATLWNVVHQALLSMGFSRQEYWSMLPFPTPEDLANPEIKPTSLVSPAMAVDSLPLVPPGRPHITNVRVLFHLLLLYDVMDIALRPRFQFQ